MMTERGLYSVLIIGSLFSVGYFLLVGAIVAASFRKLEERFRERLVDIYGWLSACPVLFVTIASVQGHSVWRDIKSPIVAVLMFSAAFAFASTGIIAIIESSALRKARMLVVASAYAVVVVSFVVISVSRLTGFELS